MSLKLIKLDELSQIIMGQSPPGLTYNDKGIGLPFFQGKSEFGEIFPTPSKWCDTPIKIAKPDDILISVRAPVGSTNLANETCCIGRGLAAIRVNPELLDRDYLWHFLRYSESYLISQGQGSTFESINASDLYGLQIPVCDLNSQQKTAKKLKAQLVEVETARKALEYQQQEMVNLANAYIRESIEQIDRVGKISLPALRTVRAVLPHTALQSRIASSGLTCQSMSFFHGEKPIFSKIAIWYGSM